MSEDDLKKFEALANEMRGMHEDTREEVRELMKQVIEYTTVTRRHIAEQERIDRRVAGITDDHERRIGELEVWRGGIDRVMPKTMLDGGAIEKRLKSVESGQAAIDRKLAKYGGMALAIWGIAQVVVTPLMQFVWKFTLGG